MISLGIEIGTLITGNSEMSARIRSWLYKHSACQLLRTSREGTTRVLKPSLFILQNFVDEHLKSKWSFYIKVTIKQARSASFIVFLVINLTHPGGHTIGRPPSTCTCRWGTVSPPSFPLFMTIRKPLSRLSFAATEAAVRSRCPSKTSCDGATSEIRGMTCLGIVSKCVGACGSISWMTIQWSSSVSYTHLTLPTTPYV